MQCFRDRLTECGDGYAELKPEFDTALNVLALGRRAEQARHRHIGIREFRGLQQGDVGGMVSGGHSQISLQAGRSAFWRSISTTLNE